MKKYDRIDMSGASCLSAMGASFVSFLVCFFWTMDKKILAWAGIGNLLIALIGIIAIEVALQKELKEIKHDDE